jgi:pimeloyl-ACP methyl ester carboxylesterase
MKPDMRDLSATSKFSKLTTIVHVTNSAHLVSFTYGMASPRSSSFLPTRQTSPATGLSYLSSNSIARNYNKLCILIHGWACSAQDYVPLISALSSSILLTDTLFVAVDLPGHGHTPQSICPNPTVSLCARLVNDLRHELSPTGDFQATIIGHSMGCRITLEVFSQQPANICGIVLLDGSWYGRAPKDYKPKSANGVEELQNVLNVFDTMMGSATPEAFKQQVRQHLRAIDLDYANQLRRDYIAWDGKRTEEVLGMVGSGTSHRVRVLVVQGTEGHGVKRRSLKKGQETPWMALVKSKVGDGYAGVIVEGSGHWPQVDKLQEVAEAFESQA